MCRPAFMWRPALAGPNFKRYPHSMYTAVLILHSWLRWIALILGVMTTFAALTDRTDRTAGQSTVDRWSLFFMMVLDIQMLLGLLLYLVLSPFTASALSD